MAEEGVRVLLNVYDLSQGMARQLSTMLLGKAIDGIWHTGIVVYGVEFYFSGGIARSYGGETVYGKPIQVVELGVTHVPKEVFEEYLQEISPRYTAETYNLLKHNCNNFTNEVAQFLLGTTIPEFILRLPQDVMSSPMASLIMPMIQQIETTMKYGAVPQMPQLVGSNSSMHAASSSFQQPVAASKTASNTDIGGTANASVEAVNTQLKATSLEATGPKPSDAGIALEKASGAETSKPKSAGNTGDSISEAKVKVQEEIAREFATLMANGSLRASEAAALAARRVMQKHGITAGVPSQR